MPFYDDQNNKISLIFFVDEVSFSKSSNNNKMYAVICQIAELPEIVRSAYRNIIPMIFFVGPHPNFNSLFRNYLQQLDLYIGNGRTLKSNKKEYNLCVHAFIADAPARAKVLNISQFNGEYGCFHCMHPGEKIGERNRGNKRVFSSKVYRIRDNSLYSAQIREVKNKKEVLYGLKWSTYLSKWINLPDACLIDYMHLSLEGEVKKLIILWFCSTNSGKNFYIGFVFFLNSF